MTRASCGVEGRGRTARSALSCGCYCSPDSGARRSPRCAGRMFRSTASGRFLPRPARRERGGVKAARAAWIFSGLCPASQTTLTSSPVAAARTQRLLQGQGRWMPRSAMPPWTLHDLRRTARSLMSRAGVRPEIAERVLGHAIERRGRHLRPAQHTARRRPTRCVPWPAWSRASSTRFAARWSRSRGLSPS